MDFFTKQRGKIIIFFKIVYVLATLFVLTIFVALRGNDITSMFIYEVGKKFGDLSLMTYILTLLPGMGERFGIQHTTLSILRSYRRYIGILMFILALAHVSLTKFFLPLHLMDYYFRAPMKLWE